MKEVDKIREMLDKINGKTPIKEGVFRDVYFKPLNEVKLNRIVDYHFKNGFITISSERYIPIVNFLNGQEETEENLNNAKLRRTEYLNKLRTELMSDIKSSGRVYIPLQGGFIENGKEVIESSFLVPRIETDITNNGISNDPLFKLGENLCGKYDQYSFLYKAGGDNNLSCFYDRNGNADGVEFNALTLNDITQIYFSKLHKDYRIKKHDEKRGPGKADRYDKADRRWSNTFECIVYVQDVAKTTNERRIREMKGELQIIDREII